MTQCNLPYGGVASSAAADRFAMGCVVAVLTAAVAALFLNPLLPDASHSAQNHQKST